MAAGSSTHSPVVFERRGQFVAGPGAATAELTIVVPTLNERDNIVPFLAKVEAVLTDVAWELIFVDDDSPDGTADAVRTIARSDPRVRCLQRLGRRGLSTACIEGILASASLYVAVMDADMQHDERLLPQMLNLLKSATCDLAVGSRYIPGGGVGDWQSSRANISGFATVLSRLVCRVRIADPMSGFFMLRRDVFEGSMRRLSGQGFKILLDLIASSPRTLRVQELPFEFRTRQYGKTKLDTLVAWEFVMLLADKTLGSKVPVQFVTAAFITAFGFAINLVTRWVALDMWDASQIASRIAAISVSAGGIFFLNQLFTHRDNRLAGRQLAHRILIFFLSTIAFGLLTINAASACFNTPNDSPLAIVAGTLLSTISSYAIARIVSRPRKWKPLAGFNDIAPVEYQDAGE